MGVLVFIAIVAALLYQGYQWLKKQSYLKRLTIKIILSNVALVMAGMGVILLVSCVVAVYTATNESSLPYRQMEVEDYLAQGDYYYADMTLRLGDDYEPVFDYAWERVAMYYTYDSYLLFNRALDNEELSPEWSDIFAQRKQEYEVQLRTICEKSQLEENQLYKEFYLRKLEQDAEESAQE